MELSSMNSANGAGAANGRHKALDIAIDAIFELIQRREILPGSRLFETELEERLSISRTPIRQAFGQLAADGVFERRPNQKGFFFPRFSIDDLCHAYLYREYLEVLSARLATVNFTPESATRLQTALANEEKLYELRMIETYRDIHNSFHVTLASATGNPYLEKSVKSIYLKFSFYEFYYGTYRTQKHQEEAHGTEYRLIKEHEVILEAIAEGRADSAVALMKSHLRSSPLALDYIKGESRWQANSEVLWNNDNISERLSK